MDLLIAFLVFIVVMVSAIIFDYTMIIALVIGLAAFMLVGKHRGFSFCTKNDIFHHTVLLNS